MKCFSYERLEFIQWENLGCWCLIQKLYTGCMAMAHFLIWSIAILVKYP